MDFDEIIESISKQIINSFNIKVVVYDKNILPIYFDDRDLIFVVSKKLNNIFSIAKNKCVSQQTKNGTLYYRLVPTSEDINLNKVPIRPMGCPKNMKDLELSKLSDHEHITTLK